MVVVVVVVMVKVAMMTEIDGGDNGDLIRQPEAPSRDTAPWVLLLNLSVCLPVCLFVCLSVTKLGFYARVQWSRFIINKMITSTN